MFLVIEGEFETTKQVKNSQKDRKQFSMTEFLPQTKNKAYKYNLKNNRFINVVNTFKAKGDVDKKDNLRIMLIGKGSFVGEEDAIKDRLYSTTVRCTS